MAKKSKKEAESFGVDFSDLKKVLLATIATCIDREQKREDRAYCVAAKYFDPSKLATMDQHKELMDDILLFPHGCDTEESPE